MYVSLTKLEWNETLSMSMILSNDIHQNLGKFFLLDYDKS